MDANRVFTWRVLLVRLIIAVEAAVRVHRRDERLDEVVVQVANFTSDFARSREVVLAAYSRTGKAFKLHIIAGTIDGPVGIDEHSCIRVGGASRFSFVALVRS